MNQTTQFTETKTNSRNGVVDFIRILLVLLIITYHIFHYTNITPYEGNKAPGYIAVEAFYIISGFFLATTAYKKDAPIWYRYTWRKLWSFLPLFILGILFGVVMLSINCLIYMQPAVKPLTEIFINSWFLWYLVGYGGFLYLAVNKGRDKFSYSSIAIAFVCYLATALLCGSVNDATFFSEQAWQGILFKFGICSFRSIGGLCLGIFIYVCSIKLTKTIKNAWKIVLSIVGIICGITGIVINFIWPSSLLDFLTIVLFFTFFFILFCNLGAIAEKVKIPSNIGIYLRDLSLCIYIVQGAWLGIMYTIGDQMPYLYDHAWYVDVYVICCYIGAILIGVGLKATYKPIKNKLLPKFKVLNKI